MRLQRIDGGRGHGSAHIVGVLDAVILNFSDGRGLNARPVAAFSHDAAAGASHGPLGCRRALAAVAEREAVLPLRRGKMRRGMRCRRVRKARIDERRRQKQRFGHGRARAVKPQKRDRRAARRERRGNALVQQISREQHINVLIAHAELPLRRVQRQLL